MESQHSVMSPEEMEETAKRLREHAAFLEKEAIRQRVQKEMDAMRPYYVAPWWLYPAPQPQPQYPTITFGTTSGDVL